MAFNLQEMISQSQLVITRPSIATFEQFEKSGKLQEALIYVGIGAAVSGLLGLVGGLNGFILNILLSVIVFFLSTYVLYSVGKWQGGTGTWDEVAYTFALFSVPLSILAGLGAFILIITVLGILLLPVWGLAVLGAYLYFTYLAAQSSLNLSGNAIWSVLFITFVANIIICTTLYSLFS